MNITKTKPKKGISNEHRVRFSVEKSTIIHYSLDETLIAGYGRCHSCDCKGYISKHNGSHECKTCNHHYDRHS